MIGRAPSRSPGRLLRGAVMPKAFLFWAFTAMCGHADSFSSGRYHSSGQVLLSDGSVLPISQSLMLEENRFQSMTQSSTVTVEVTGRVETDLFGRIRLLIEERHVSGPSAEDEMDAELMFNLLYGRHRGGQINLERVGSCFYGIETRKVYCADDHSQHENR